MDGLFQSRWMPGTSRLRGAGLQALLLLSLLWCAGALAWISLAAVDFGYPLLYRVLDIDQHISRYGPENRYRHGFELTSRDQRLALFGQINEAVHRGGKGLASLTYPGPRGRAVPLLREPEVVHLTSVARLIDLLARISWVMLVLLGLSVILLRRARASLAPARRLLLGSVGAAAGAALLVLVIGPERVFNTLHVWVFPAGEQWYFFYQESLMTTLMKAPDLFGAIAGMLALLTLVFFAVGLVLVYRLLPK